MKERLVVWLQYGCLTVGALLVSVVAFARLEGEAGRQSAIESFHAASTQPDQSLWSQERIDGFQASLAAVSEPPVAILRVPDLKLEVPVYAGASELHLNRGAGLIEGMGLPDKGGNVGIAGHRDGFFRVLKDIQPGQRIEIETRRAYAPLPRRLDRGGESLGPARARGYPRPDGHPGDLLPVLLSRQRTAAIHRAGRL